LTGPEGKGFLLAAQATGQFAGVFDELIPRIRDQVSEKGLAGVLEQLSTSGQKAVNVFSQFETLSSKLQDARIQTTLPATLAAASAMGEGINAISKDDGILDRFRLAIVEVVDALKNFASILNPMKLVEKAGTIKEFVMGDKTTAVSEPRGVSGGESSTETYLRELVELNKNAQRALNTLVTVSAMTEKNTKNMNNNVANMSGSLV
jgi:hypothetical protein